MNPPPEEARHLRANGRSSGRLLSVEWAALGLIVVFLGFLAFSGLGVGHIHNGDSDNLVKGVAVAIDCISDGVWKACGYYPGTVQTEVFPYPLLPYLPAAAMTWLGAGAEGALEGLARLNFFALVGIIAALGLTFWNGNKRWLAPVSIVVLITGPVAYFATTAFGEMLGAAMVLGAVLAAYHRSTGLTLVFATLATISRETMAPFVLALIAVALVLSSSRSERRWRAVAISGAVGVGIGVALNLGFNVFRFAGIRNLNYLDPLLRVQNLPDAVEFFAMLNVAPGGGLLFFWPLALLVALGVIGLALFRLVKEPRAVGRWLAPVLLGLIYSLFLTGLSLWYSPFGWLSWGPRLLVPIVPAFVFLGLVVLGPALARMTTKLQTGRRWIPWAIVFAVVAISIPQWSGPWVYNDVLNTLTTPDAICEPLHEIHIQDGADEYYRCIPHIAWRWQPSQLATAATGGGGRGWVARIVGSLTAATLLLAAYQRFRSDQMTQVNHAGGTL